MSPKKLKPFSSKAVMSSMATSLTLTEQPDLEACRSVWRHPAVKPEVRKRLKNYCDAALRSADGSVKVKYQTKYECGRYYVEDASLHSACPMPGRVRATLFGATEHDVDIVNCHANLLLDLAERHFPDQSGLYTSLSNYVLHRDAIIKAFGLEKDMVKALFNIILYGGTVVTWKRHLTEEFDGFELPTDFEMKPLVAKFEAEVKVLTTLLLNRDEFKPVAASFYKHKRGCALARFGKDFDEEKFTLHDGKKLSAILQQRERIVLDAAMAWVAERGATITAYCYDGFQVRKEGWSEEHLAGLNAHVAQCSPRVRFIVKPFKPPLDLSEVPPESERFDRETFNLIDTYEYKKEYFERFHFRCLDPPCFVKLGEEDELQYITMDKLPKMYPFLKYFHKEKDKWVSFIGQWVADEDMRLYDQVDVRPPPLRCPPHVFNGWTGFPIEQVALDADADTSRLHKHLDLVANHHPETYEWLLNYLAHIVQKPGIKPLTAVLIQGKEGSGKSVVGEHFMTKIIGRKRRRISGKIDQILGRFADARGLLVTVFNETSGKDTFAKSDLLKDYITAVDTRVEKKGVDDCDARLFDRFFASTNSEWNCLPVNENDRRWMIISMDCGMANNAAYFNPLYADLESDVVMRKFYEELKGHNISEWHPANSRPQSALAALMKSLNREPTALFKDFLFDQFRQGRNQAYGHIYDWKKDAHGRYVIKANDLYLTYEQWWKEECRDIKGLLNRTKFCTMFKTKYVAEVEKKGCVFYAFEVNKEGA